MTEARKAVAIGNRLAPRRFLLFIAVVVAGYFAYSAAWPASKWADAAAMAFDAGAVVFLASLLPLLRDSSADIIRDHAAKNDANRTVILIVTSLLTIAAMVAIAGELDGARQGQAVSLVKLVGTLLLIWLFANSIYALHYAHAWYTRSDETDGDMGGIEFPGTDAPAYRRFRLLRLHAGDDLPDLGREHHRLGHPPRGAAALVLRLPVQHRRDRLHDQRAGRRG